MSERYSTKLSFEIPLFLAYVTGNDACDVLLELEKEYDVKFVIGEDSVYVEGLKEQDLKPIKKTLSDAWKMDNFHRAIEICELTTKSDYQFLFEVSPSEAALIQLNAKTILHRTRVLQLKTDNNGHVCIFGNGTSIYDAYDTIVSFLRKASFKSNTALQGFNEEPCVLLMHIPSAIAQFIFSNDKRSVNALERSSRCVVEPHFRDTDAAGYTKIDIITKDLPNALAAKAALMELIESHVGKIHKWPTPVTICCGSRISRSIPEVSCRTLDECEAVLHGPTSKSLTFSVPDSEASRLIGTRGLNKKRIEERTNCFISLHTEAKQGGEFPVEIIGQNVKECEAAQAYIHNFLKETRRMNKNMTRSSLSGAIQSSQRFNSEVELSQLNALSSTYNAPGGGGGAAPGTVSAYFAAPGAKPSGGGGGGIGPESGGAGGTTSAYFAAPGAGGGGVGCVSAYFSPTAPGGLGGRVPGAPAVGVIDPTKTAIGAVDPTRTAIGAVDPTKTAIGAVDPTRTAIGAVDPTRTAIGAVDPTRTAIGAVDPTRTAIGAVDPTRTAIGAVDPTKTAIGAVDPTRTAIGSVDPTKTAIGAVDPTRTAIGAVDPTRTAIGAVDPTRTAIGAVDPTRTAIGAVDPTRTAIGAVDPTKTAIGSPVPDFTKTAIGAPSGSPAAPVGGGGYSPTSPGGGGATSAYFGVGGGGGGGYTSAYFGVGGGGGAKPTGGGADSRGGATSPGVSAYFSPSGGAGGAPGATSAYFSVR
ncbi:unnamed protein product [Cercopithifilaria johnstoni]|uniref:K Homology domain-containing protein n=1 Tax=Cercopithifilaria johnstoni TaxID=2874296 RepID=A0A8J2PTP3_9BILA|nr:unnamed protein product [Cercopithifilaria johnstoni]